MIATLHPDVSSVKVYQGGFLVYEAYRDQTGAVVFNGTLQQCGLQLQGRISRITYKDGRTETVKGEPKQ